MHALVVRFALLLVAALLPAPAAVAAELPRSTTSVLLPGDAEAARVGETGPGWIVAGRPGAATRSAAGRFDAAPLMPAAGVYQVPRSAARPFAEALEAGGLLALAEPNTRATPHAFPADPLTPDQWWLPTVADPGLTPPPVGRHSPLLAVIDSQVDIEHPELQGGRVRSTNRAAESDGHGTAVTAVAAAAANGVGIVGLWPGMRILAVPNDLSCAALVKSLAIAVRRRAAVINMSYGWTNRRFCASHLLATNRAYRRGAVLAASAGNDSGRPRPEYPASDPHVLTVTGVDATLAPAFPSHRRNGLDMSAPGVDVLTAVPPLFDPDETKDGYARVRGTSVATPMVAAAAAWLRAARPRLGNSQVSELLRRSARDLGTPGWDPGTGWGLLDLAAALRARAPRPDPLEPNDARHSARRLMVGVGRRRAALRASVGGPEDPADVYRIVLRGRSVARVRLEAIRGPARMKLVGRRSRRLTVIVTAGHRPGSPGSDYRVRVALRSP